VKRSFCVPFPAELAFVLERNRGRAQFARQHRHRGRPARLGLLKATNGNWRLASTGMANFMAPFLTGSAKNASRVGWTDIQSEGTPTDRISLQDGDEA
jgi:hypothetical protein